MDEVRVFGSMLGGHEIAAWKDVAMGHEHPSAQALVAHFTFDSANGETLVNRAAPAIGLAAKMNVAPTVVQDIISAGSNMGRLVAIDSDTMVHTSSTSSSDLMRIYRRRYPGRASSQWELVQEIDGRSSQILCGFQSINGADDTNGVGDMAIHGDVIVSTCTGLSDFYAVDTKAFAVVLTRDVPGNLSSTWSLSHKVTKAEQRDGTDVSRIRSCAVHGDTVVFGKPDPQNGGYVLVYAREPPDSTATAAWTQVQLVQPLVPNALDAYTAFGSGVAIYGDQLVVGAHEYRDVTDDEARAVVSQGYLDPKYYNDYTWIRRNAKPGSVYVFNREVPDDAFSTWTETAQMTPAFETAPFYQPGSVSTAVNHAQTRFGRQVDLQDDVLVVAATGADRWGSLKFGDTGQVAVYRRLNASLTSPWMMETVLYPEHLTDERDVQNFGARISYRDGVLAVAAPDEGVVYVYTRSPSFDGGFEWSHVPHDFFVPDSTGDRKAQAGCGWSAATDGAVVVMGCKTGGRSSVFSIAPDVGDGEVSSRSDDYVLWNTAEHITLAVASSATETTYNRTGPTSMYFNGADTKVTTRCGSNDATHVWNCGGASAATGYSGLKPDDFLTFTAWIKPDEGVSGQTIAMLGEWGWGVLLMCPGGSGKGCCGDHVTNAIGFWSDNDVTATSCAETLSSDVGVTRGVWNHIAVVVDASHYTNEVLFYINGNLAGRRRSSKRGNIVAPLGGMDHAPFVIGRGPCPNGCLDYKGHIDELSVYAALWSASDISSWYDKPAAPATSTTRASPHFALGVLGYSFDGARGNAVKNVFPDPDEGFYAGNRFDGVITSRDAGDVVWDASDRASLTSAPEYASPPPSHSPSPSFAGSSNSSLRFDGAEASAFLKESSEGGKYLDFTDSGVMTFEAWIKPERFGKFQFLAATEGFDGDRAGWSIAIMCPDGAGEGCCGDHVDGSLGFMARKAVSSDCANARSTKTSLTLDTWQHVAVSVDATQTVANTGIGMVRRKVSFYVNGELVGVSTSSQYGAYAPIQLPTPTHGPDASGVRFGAGLCGQSDDLSVSSGETRECGHFQGLLDEMKLWRASLSDVTVRTHYDKEIVPWHVNVDALVAHFNFADGKGVSVPFETRVNTTGCGGGSVVDLTDCTAFRMNNLTLHPASLESTFWHSDAHAIAPAVTAPPPSPPPTSPPPSPPPRGGPSSLYFNGRDTHAMAPYVDSLLPGTGLTFQAWIKPEELHRSQVLAMLGDNGWALMLTCNEGSGAGCCGNHLTHAPGTLMFWNVEQVPQADASDVCRDAPTSTRRVVKDKWQHVAVVADEETDTVRFFIDGEPAGVRENARGGRDRLVNDGGSYVSRVAQLYPSDAPFHFGDGALALRGDVAVVGVPNDSAASNGKVYVFERDASGWSETAILQLDSYPSSTYRFGATVDINSAGDVIVVGHGSSVVSGQAVYVYTRNLASTPDANWTLAQTLTDDTANDFGFSVAIDKADDTIVVGAKKAVLDSVNDVGAAFVFARTSSSWTQVGVLRPEEPAGTNLASFLFGTSVAIDGGVIVVNNMKSADTNNPAAYVYERDDMDDVQSSWSFVSRLREEGDSYFARWVMVDGDTIALTGRGKKMVHVYTRAKFGDRDSTWVLANQLALPDDLSGVTSSFDGSFDKAALSGDTIVVGSYGALVAGYENGAAFVFTRDDPEDAFSTWSVDHQFTGTFANAIVNLNPEPSGWIQFGINVAIDGDELIVGASVREPVAPVQVFSKTPSGFTLGRSGFCRCLQYKGFMDEVSLWNASLSVEDVKIHHAMPPVQWHRSYDSLVAYWAFDEGGLESTDTLPSALGKEPRITVVSSSDPADVLWDAGVNLVVSSAPAPPPSPPARRGGFPSPAFAPRREPGRARCASTDSTRRWR
jgi:hypothetical protein